MMHKKITEISLPFGQASDGRMVRVDEVERGLRCNCQCPECERKLVAAKGGIVKHHFRHARVEGCTFTAEKAIHKYAKQIICEKMLCRVPDNMGRPLSFKAEYREMGDLIPDVYAEFEKGPVAIEIWVGNRKSNEHVKRYNDRRLAAVEIDCRDYDPDEPSNWDWFILFSAPREWLSPPAYIRQQREEAEAEKRRIEDMRAKEAARRHTLALFEQARRQEEADRRYAAELQRRQQQAEAEAAEASRLATENLRLAPARDAIKRGLGFEYVTCKPPYNDLQRFQPSDA